MQKVYNTIDKIWGLISETVFVRFEFSMPVEELREHWEKGRLIFASPYGGFIEWLILSSWCRRQKFGAVLVTNRKRILFFSKPLYFFQRLLGTRTYGDLFLCNEPGPRLMFCPTRDRKRPNDPTPAEVLLTELVTKTKIEEREKLMIVPVFIRWRKHVRGESRKPSEYLFGLSSSPNLIGKIWYLLRKRSDSTVLSLQPFSLAQKDSSDGNDFAGESEATRLAKTARRRVLVLVAQEMRVAVGPRYHSPIEVKETLMRDEDILKVVAEVAEARGVDKKKVMMEAYQNLTEIAANYRYRFIEVMHLGLQWLFTNVFDGLVYSEAELQVVRETMRNKSVIFVSCHRSHLDYLVVPYLLFRQDIVTPHIVAGVNLAFWPVGPFLRFGGAFFIRRSFRGDILYTTCLRKYVEYLLKNRYNINLFIEGTRSRSGKMLPPAYGILKMVLETYARKGVDDIALVPTSLCYDEVLEERSYTKELTGAKKEKESARGFLESRKLKRNLGKVYVHFGKPVFVKDVYQKAEELGQDATLMLQKTAFDLSKKINDVTPVTPKALVSAVFLGSQGRKLTLDTILKKALLLGEYVESTGSELSVPVKMGLTRAIEQVIRKLQRTGKLIANEDSPKTFEVDPKFRIALNFYKNSGMHCFVLPAITMIAFDIAIKQTKDNGSQSDIHEKFVSAAVQLRNLLKFEFFFSPTPVFINELGQTSKFFFGTENLSANSKLELIKSLESRMGTTADVSYLKCLVGDIVEAYLTTMEFLRGATGSVFEKKGLPSRIVKFAEVLDQERKLHFPESMSVQTYQSAFSFMESIGLLESEEKSMIRVLPWTSSGEEAELKLKALLQAII